MFVTIALAALFISCGPIRAQDCQCDGNPIGRPFSGGMGDPLKWVYTPHLVRPSPQELICYYKEVNNKSNADVRDVNWEVAGYYRKIIPAGIARTACPQVAGDTKPAPTNGPLYYGSSRYDTTVLQPKDGWETASASGPDGSNTGSGPILTALTFDVEDGAGKLAAGRLTFVSSVKTDGDKNFLTYSVTNDSLVELSVLVNLTATSSILAKVPMIQRSFMLSPKEHRTFDAVAEGKSSIEPAAIVVYDMKKQISAIDTAGFYTVRGIKEREDQMFWKSVR
jgi:hypothetical protein